MLQLFTVKGDIKMKKMKSLKVTELTWDELPIAGIVPEPATSLAYKTGSWRGGFKPVINQEECTRCMKCWLFCPDMAVLVSKEGDKLRLDINYEFCKGCGICEKECPVDAIEMVRE